MATSGQDGSAEPSPRDLRHLTRTGDPILLRSSKSWFHAVCYTCDLLGCQKHEFRAYSDWLDML